MVSRSSIFRQSQKEKARKEENKQNKPKEGVKRVGDRPFTKIKGEERE